ncbi:MAG TPA: IS110 family transposase [Gemmataceae bacterium]|nr:IS110 family transposase [Gemmataceae bacterium]
MTTTTKAPAADTILALDPGKYKTVACAYRGDPVSARFETLTTDREHLRRLFAKHRPAVVVFEACALAGWVADLCEEIGLVCRVANTASEAWKFKHQKRKTDRDDALRLAQLQALGQLPAVHVPPPQTRQWRALVAARQALVGRRCAAQNRVRALLVGQGLPAPRGAKAWTELGLEGIGQHAKPLIDCAAAELWRGLLGLALTEFRQARELIDQAEARLGAMAKADAGVRLLETIPGVGPRTAEAVVACLSDASRFGSGKPVSADAGLVPRQYRSGESDRRGRITKRGPALLRKLLVECARVMLRYNAWAREVYLRLSRGKARKKQAIVALARRLLVRCWAMLRDQAPWRAEAKVEAAPG